MTRPELQKKVEELVDAASFLEVVSVLGETAYLKAEHLRANWQDGVSADFCDEVGKMVSEFEDKLRKHGVA